MNYDISSILSQELDWWNLQKQHINAKKERVYFRDGEIWWVHLGLNIGFEINGKGIEHLRPVIVLKKYNMYSFLALPLSTSSKTNDYRIPIGTIDGKNATANLSQLRNIDSKRLAKRICELDPVLFNEIKKKASEANFG